MKMSQSTNPHRKGLENYKKNPSWQEMRTHLSCYQDVNGRKNPFYEPFTRNRFNPSKVTDGEIVRIVFLNSLTRDHGPAYRALVKSGRPVWCTDLRYDGVDNSAQRQFSFRLTKGKKRFVVSEKYALLIPSRSYIHPAWPNSLHLNDGMLFKMGTVFAYPPAVRAMYLASTARKEGTSLIGFEEQIRSDHPLVPGSLVSPRIGMFRLTHLLHGEDPDAAFPYGLVLRREKETYSELFGRELFMIRFGQQIQRNVHIAELEPIR